MSMQLKLFVLAVALVVPLSILVYRDFGRPSQAKYYALNEKEFIKMAYKAIVLNQSGAASHMAGYYHYTRDDNKAAEKWEAIYFLMKATNFMDNIVTDQYGLVQYNSDGKVMWKGEKPNTNDWTIPVEIH
jgi:hypothetical protein